eukprot:1667636-Lingulodinium_polyedra.AAC.1
MSDSFVRNHILCPDLSTMSMPRMGSSTLAQLICTTVGKCSAWGNSDAKSRNAQQLSGCVPDTSRFWRSGCHSAVSSSNCAPR